MSWPEDWSYYPEKIQLPAEEELTVKQDLLLSIAIELEQNEFKTCALCGYRFIPSNRTVFFETCYCTNCRLCLRSKLTRMERGYKKSCPIDLKKHLFSKQSNFTGTISYGEWKNRREVE